MRRLAVLGLALACGRERAAETAPPVAPMPTAESHPHAAHAMHQRFENAQEWSRVFDAPDRDAWQKPDAVIATLKLKRNSIVADLGAGTGYFTVRLAKVVPKGTVFATDVEADMVAHIESRAREAGLDNVVAKQSRADNPGLGEPVDVAFLCDVVHHLEDRPAFFAKLAERLRPDGRIVIVDFSPDAPPDGPGPPQEHRLSIQTLDVELGAAELERTATDVDLLPYQYVLEYRPRRR